MKRYTHILIFVCLFTGLQGNGQTVINPTVPASEWIRFNILNIDAHAFPHVSVSFIAESESGNHVLNIHQSKIHLLEDGKPCDVISLQRSSNNKPVYLSIVVDHSGSMEEDPALLYDKSGCPLYTVDENDKMITPSHYISPIEHAKNAIKEFIADFDTKKDFISITGFGSAVDYPLALTHDQQQIYAAVESMKAEGKTALYDGIITGMEQINRVNGIKAVVVITDGSDNMSTSKYTDVINMAIKENIAVNIIGTGEVNKGILQKIAGETNGQFFYTSSSNSLKPVYDSIREKIHSVFQFEYISSNNNLQGKPRDISLYADLKNAIVVEGSASFLLPADLAVPANSLLQQEIRNELLTSVSIPGSQPLNYPVKNNDRQDNSYIIYGNVAATALASVAAAVHIKRAFTKKIIRRQEQVL